jgi:hypothetical protein
MTRFEAHLLGYEKKLKAELEIIRADFEHSGNKGAGAEAAFRRFLGEHLPRRLEVGHGEAVDSKDNVAGGLDKPGQIDAIIIDDRHPRFVSASEPAPYLIEAILAAGEIKSMLTSRHLRLTLEKAARFRFRQR